MAKLPETKKRKITNLILLALENAVDGFIRFDDYVKHSRAYTYGRLDYPLKKASLAKALQRLRHPSRAKKLEGFLNDDC